MINYDMITACTDAVNRGFMDRPINCFEVWEGQAYCLRPGNEISSIYDLQSKNKYIAEEFILACLKQTDQKIEINSAKLLELLDQISRGNKDEIRAIADSIRKDLVYDYDWLAQKAIDEAWSDPEICNDRGGV